MNEKIESAKSFQTQELRRYNIVYGGLILFLILTVGSSFIRMGLFNPLANLLFALAKASLVIWYFMHMRHSSKNLWVFVLAGFIWLAILAGFVFSDIMTRGFLPVYGK